MLGIHIHKHNASLSETLENELPKFAKSAQLFLLNPMSGMNNTAEADIVAIKKYITRTNKTIIAHGSYVDIPWSSGSTEMIKQEFALCYKAGVAGLVVHLGVKTTETISEVLQSLLKMKAKYLDSVVLWLEINSHKPTEGTFETPKKINKLWATIREVCNGTALLCGLCIDTAHLWACGTSMATFNGAKKFLDDLDSDIPIMFHLNDSTEEIGTGKDIHAPVCDGKIWRQFAKHPEKSGIAYIVEYAIRNNSVVILERHENEADKDIKVLKKLGFIK